MWLPFAVRMLHEKERRSKAALFFGYYQQAGRKLISA
jgi:hypothetical protein